MKAQASFGIFHTTYEKNPEIFYQIMNSDFVDTLVVECDYRGEEFLKTFEELLKHEDKSAWVSITWLCFKTVSVSGIADTGESVTEFNPVTILYDDYRERIDGLIAYLKRQGWYDKVVGFYMDEPLLWNIGNDNLEACTGYFRTVAAPDKRFFICFSIAGVAPEYWTINNVQPITAKSSQYLTDIAFDQYHKFSDDYEHITRLMLDRCGNRPDLRVWFVPCTMDYRGDKTEEHCLEHLEGCYELYKKYGNGGGLMCFTFYTFKPDEEALGNIGLDLLTDPTYPKYWPGLYERIQEIGREIIRDRK